MADVGFIADAGDGSFGDVEDDVLGCGEPLPDEVELVEVFFLCVQVIDIVVVGVSSGRFARKSSGDESNNVGSMVYLERIQKSALI